MRVGEEGSRDKIIFIARDKYYPGWYLSIRIPFTCKRYRWYRVIEEKDLA